MEFRCRACGFRSFNAGMFVEERRHALFERRRCIGCGPAARTRHGPSAVLLAGALLLLVSIWCGQPHSLLGCLLVFGASLPPAAFATSVIHELGHAAATWMTGGRVLGITIGSGSVVWRLRTPLFALEAAGNPLWGGRIQHRHGDGAARRWKEALVLAGGAGANLLTDVALFALLGWLDAGRRPGEPWSVAMVAILALAAAQTFSVVMNLWPWSFQRGEEMLATDGGRLLALLGDPGFDDRAAQATPRAGDFEPERSGVMADLAWRALLAGRTDWLDLADRLSARAAQLNPHGKVKATRGAVLMAKGELEDGEAMILAALPQIEAATDKAGFCDFLARYRPDAGAGYLSAEYARMSRHLAAAA